MLKILLGIAGAMAMLMTSGTVEASDMPGVTKQVLAFYYGWYSGAWAPTAHFTPADGSYQSMSPAEVDKQMAQIAAAGITGVIAEWQPNYGRYVDAQLPILLAAAQAHGLKVSAMLSSYTTTPVTTDMVASYFTYLVSRYGSHPAWLQVNGSPVVFLWSGGLIGLPTAAAWDQVLTQLRSSFPGLVVLSDGQNDQVHLPQTKAAFTSLFHYNEVPSERGKTLPEIQATEMKEAIELAAATPPSKIFCLTVMPGYDDSQTTRAKPRPIVPRYNGETYRAAWRAALAANPDWVLVGTYNEWIEGTQIEPSVQFGTQALTDTANFAKQFMALPMRQ